MQFYDFTPGRIPERSRKQKVIVELAWTCRWDLAAIAF
jgi:hypothetical protein